LDFGTDLQLSVNILFILCVNTMLTSKNKVSALPATTSHYFYKLFDVTRDFFRIAMTQ
jgi:hypothetical protein